MAGRHPCARERASREHMGQRSDTILLAFPAAWLRSSARSPPACKGLFIRGTEGGHIDEASAFASGHDPGP